MATELAASRDGRQRRQAGQPGGGAPDRGLRAGVWRVAVLWAAAGAGMAWGQEASGLSGFVLSVHYEREGLGGIHDSATPGELRRHDLANGKVVGWKVLYEGGKVGAVCLGPFGRRVAFTRPDGMIAVVSADGGPATDLVSFIGDETPKDNPATGLQWPASEGGEWIYYFDGRNGGRNNTLRRVNATTREDQFVVTFNRGASGGFALSMDATPRHGTLVKRTDNYVIAIYDLSAGDGDLYSCPRAGGCGESLSPDGALFVANNGWHTVGTLYDLTGRGQQSFRLNQWDGDPTDGISDRGKVEWAWQFFRWSVNSMKWIAVTQGKLKVPSTHEIHFSDAVVYNWVDGQQINITGNPPGLFDRAGGLWVGGTGASSLGYQHGEAPFTVTFADPRLGGGAGGAAWQWDFGDGGRAEGVPATHRFTTASVHTVTATRAGEVFRGQVTVSRRLAPAAAVDYVGPHHLQVTFSESVRQTPEFRAVVDGAAVASAELNATGRRLRVATAEPVTADTTLHLGGVTDLAQEPNALTKADLPVRIPPWPTRRDGLVWLWEDAGRPAALFDEKAGAVRELRAFRDQGTAGFDRYRRMRLAGGRMGTGFFSQTGEGMDFWRVVKANEFSLELTFQPAALTQGTPAGEGRFPVRLVNCSAWHDADWEFMLGQQGDKLLYSIRTVDNFLNMNGERVKGDLHGRAPAYEIATLADTRPHHLVVSYKPGTLVAFMDGRRVFATDQVTGNLAWGYGELCFGDNHNGGRHRWHGRIEGVALYHRFVAEAEAAANATVYLAKVNARVPLPSARIEGKLLAKTTVPEVKTIHPYHDALVVNEYEVVRVVETSPGWTLRPALLPAMTIRVAQWGILDDVKTGVDGTEIGGRVPLTLEVYTGHPDKLDEQVVADTLAEDLDAPLFYEPLP